MVLLVMAALERAPVVDDVTSATEPSGMRSEVGACRDGRAVADHAG
jgi:hypothetical protein